MDSGARLRTGKRLSAPPLSRVIGRQFLELPLQRIDAPDIGRNEVIAAALVGLHLEVTAREGGRGAGAAQMDGCREILCLARIGLCAIGAREHGGDIAVEIDGSEFGRVTRDRAEMKTREATAVIHYRMIPDAEPGRLGVG